MAPDKTPFPLNRAAWLPVLVLCLGLMADAPCLADDTTTARVVRFVLMTDIHLNAGTKALHGAIQEINAMKPKPIAVLITGDLTINGFAEQYDTYLAEVANLDKAIPILAVPGNHEIVGDTDCLKLYQEKVRKDLHYSQDIAGIHFIGLSPLPLNKAPHPARDDRTHKGYMDARQLEWLEKDLASPAAQKATWVIMFDHFPLWKDYGAYEIQNTEWEGKPNDGQKRIVDLIEKHRVGAFLVGHRHHANMPPTGHEFANGSFAIHIMNETTGLSRRPGYNVYEVGDKQISSWRKVLDDCKLDGGRQLYHVAFNNPRTTGKLATAPAIQTSVAGQSVKLTWEPLPSGQIEIHRRVDRGDSPWMPIADVPGAQGRFTDDTTSDGYAYSYRVRGKSDAGYTAFSNAASALVGSVKPPEKKSR